MEPPYTPTHEIAYCMGLIVGEGCFSGGPEAPVLVVGLHASDPQPLLDLRSVFGGILYGPYTYGIRHVRKWVLRGWELEEALPYFDKWLPPSRKREQYEVWKQKWRAYFEHQRRLKPHDRPRFHRRDKSVFHRGTQCAP
jgi:hypothetical protein